MKKLFLFMIATLMATTFASGQLYYSTGTYLAPTTITKDGYTFTFSIQNKTFYYSYEVTPGSQFVDRQGDAFVGLCDELNQTWILDDYQYFSSWPHTWSTSGSVYLGNINRDLWINCGAVVYHVPGLPDYGSSNSDYYFYYRPTLNN